MTRFKLGTTVIKYDNQEPGRFYTGVVVYSNDKYSEVIITADSRNNQELWGTRFSIVNSSLTVAPWYKNVQEDKPVEHCNDCFIKNVPQRLTEAEDAVYRLRNDNLELEKRLQDIEGWVSAVKSAK